MKKFESLFFAFLTFSISLLASPLAGRSLWCDEMLRCKVFTTYSLADIWNGVALASFDSQTPLCYTIYIPMQVIFGFRLGSCLISALSASALFLLSVNAFTCISGSKPSRISMLVGSLSPSLLYFGSELWFYMPFAFFVSWFSYESMRYYVGVRKLVSIRLVISSFLTFGTHFSGAFTVATIASFVIVSFIVKKEWFKTACYLSNLLPCACLVPMYLIANTSARHMDCIGGIRWNALGTSIWWIWSYLTTQIPFYCYGVFGFAAILFGAYRMLKSRKWVAFFVCATMFSVIPYLVYSHMRGYDFNAPRFWSFATYSVLVCEMFALKSCNRIYEKMIFILLSAVCFVSVYGLVSATGRAVSYRKMSEQIDKVAPNVKAVFVNHYETRWFMWNYKFNTNRKMEVAGYWEMGESTRAKILYSIKQRKEPFVVYIGGEADEKMSRLVGIDTTPLVVSDDDNLGNMLSLVGIQRKVKFFKPYFTVVNNNK